MAFPSLSLPARLTMASFVVLAVVTVSPTLRAESPKEAADRVWSAWAGIGPGEDQAKAKKFRLLSKAVASKQGVAIIPAILDRAKQWKGEVVLVFVATVAYLPLKESTPVLEHYKSDGKPWERQAADDLLIEINSDDMKSMLESTRNE